jgi:hypothetical protein
MFDHMKHFSRSEDSVCNKELLDTLFSTLVFIMRKIIDKRQTKCFLKNQNQNKIIALPTTTNDKQKNKISIKQPTPTK